MKQDKKVKDRPKNQDERQQPLGALLAERIKKSEVALMAGPTSAWWTGDPIYKDDPDV